jgi:hypothetical protein
MDWNRPLSIDRKRQKQSMSHTTYSTPPNTPASARPWLRRTLRQESRSPPRIVRANRASCPRRKAAGFARRADGSLAELIQKLDAAILKSEGLQVCSRRTLGNAVKRFLAEHGGFDADGKYRGDSEYSTYRKYWWCGTSSPMRSWPIPFSGLYPSGGESDSRGVHPNWQWARQRERLAVRAVARGGRFQKK